MIDTVFSRLEAAKLRWMTGGDAEPTDDRLSSGQDGPELQMRMLAQASVFRQSCIRPQPPAALVSMSPLPAPDLPLLSEPLRPAFRHIMRKQDRSIWQGLIGLMAARGVMAHPFDWMPPQDPSGYPDVYIPLAKWRAGAADTAPALTADTWDDMYPAERRHAFRRLRSANPNKARALMEDHGTGLPAEERLMLLTSFEIGLSTADQPFLEQLAVSDRSAKVKSRTVGLLARLGVVGDYADANELSDFMEKSTSGLLRRKSSIGLHKRLNETQKKRAYSLFETVTFSQLAKALDVTDNELVQSYVTDPRPMMAPFINMCIRTAPTQMLMRYWGRLKADGVAQFAMLADMADRLLREDILTEVKALVTTGRLTDLRDMLAVTGADVGADISDALLNAAHYKTKLAEVKAALVKRAEGEADYQGNHLISRFDAFVTILAFLVTASHARQILSDLEDAGFHSADPLLRPLKFNIALEG